MSRHTTAGVACRPSVIISFSSSASCDLIGCGIENSGFSPLSSRAFGRPEANPLVVCATWARSYDASAADGSLSLSSAAALPALVGVKIPTNTCLSWTWPLSTHGRDADQSLLQKGQLGSVNP